MLNMSVDDRVPEQCLVTITPEERLDSDVLVFVISWPFRIWDVLQMLTVVVMFLFDKVGVDRSKGNSWQSNEQTDLVPQSRGILSVVLGSF